MILFHQVVEIFALADLDGRAALLFKRLQGRSVGPALVNRDLLREAMLAERFSEKAQHGFLVAVRRE